MMSASKNMKSKKKHYDSEQCDVELNVTHENKCAKFTCKMIPDLPI